MKRKGKKKKKPEVLSGLSADGPTAPLVLPLGCWKEAYLQIMYIINQEIQ